MKKKLFSLSCLALAIFSLPARAEDFSLEFQWGDFALCDSGAPITVKNPHFQINNVPDGTEYITFTLTDLNNIHFKHGGGRVDYTGQTSIERGAFTYLSPCPPDGQRRYEWKAEARIDDGWFSSKTLGTARAERYYPEAASTSSD